jgi:WD40 repeat protein
MKILRSLFVYALMIGAQAAQAQSAGRISNAPPLAPAIRTPAPLISTAKPVKTVAFDPSGQFLAVNQGDRIELFRGTQPASSIAADGGTILTIAFCGTNKLVAVSEDQTVKIWDVVSSRMIHRVRLNVGKRLIPAIVPGEPPLLAGGALRQVRLWNYQSGELVNHFEVNDSDAAALAFTPDGKLLVIGTTKGVVRVMDVATWKVTRYIDLDTPVRSLAASESRIAVGYGDGTVAWLNLLEDQDSIPEVKQHSGAINALAFSCDGKKFASASADKTVKVWDSETLKVLSSLEAKGGAILSVAFQPDGRQIVFGDADGNVKFWSDAFWPRAGQ